MVENVWMRAIANRIAAITSVIWEDRWLMVKVAPARRPDLRMNL